MTEELNKTEKNCFMKKMVKEKVLFLKKK